MDAIFVDKILLEEGETMDWFQRHLEEKNNIHSVVVGNGKSEINVDDEKTLEGIKKGCPKTIGRIEEELNGKKSEKKEVNNHET